MQYLIDCDDASMCVIYKKSIIPDENCSTIKVGVKVRFLWPEDSHKAQEYFGTIIASDYDEKPLLDLMQDMVKKRPIKKFDNIKKVKNADLKNSEKKDCATSKKKNAGLLQKQILDQVNAKRLKNQQISSTSRVPQDSDWIAHEIETIKSGVILEINNFQKYLLGKLDFIKTSFASTSIDHKIEKFDEKSSASKASLLENSDKNNESKVLIGTKRRSYGMFIDFEEENLITGNTEMEYIETSTNEKKESEKILFKDLGTSDNTKPVTVRKKRSYGMIADSDDDNIESHNSTKPVTVRKKRSYGMIADSDDDNIESHNSESFDDGISCSVQKSGTGAKGVSVQDFLFDDWIDEATNEKSSNRRNQSLRTSVDSEKELFDPSLSLLLKESDVFNELLAIESAEPSTSSTTSYTSDRSYSPQLMHSKKIIKEEDTNNSFKYAKGCSGQKTYHKSVCIIESDNEEKENVVQKENAILKAHPSVAGECTKNYTMKYVTGDGKKIKELLKGSEVYINNANLENVLNRTKHKSTELARGLFKAIFKEEALKSCSLTGAKPKGNAKHDVRPGLPKNAVETILTYVMKYSEKKGWEVQSRQQIKASLRSLLQEYKATKDLNDLS